jgi:Triosephosphate isomerase
MEALMCEKDVDGALVGGASLNADSFTRIYDGAVVVSEAKRAKASWTEKNVNHPASLGFRICDPLTSI